MKPWGHPKNSANICSVEDTFPCIFDLDERVPHSGFGSKMSSRTLVIKWKWLSFRFGEKNMIPFRVLNDHLVHSSQTQLAHAI